MTFTTELKRIKKVILAAVLTNEESMDSTRMNSSSGGAGSMRTGAIKGATGGEQVVAGAAQTSS